MYTNDSLNIVTLHVLIFNSCMNMLVGVHSHTFKFEYHAKFIVFPDMTRTRMTLMIVLWVEKNNALLKVI